jgi:hypothetical protein
MWAGDNDAKKIEKQTFRVSLNSGLGTATSQPNQPVSTVVLEPAEYAGWEVVGKIGKLVPAKRGKSKPAELEFHLETLGKENMQIPISADVIEVTNSKGVKGVDEEGNVIGKTSNKKKAAGGILGGIAGGAAGYALGGAGGAAAGAAAGALAGVYMVKMTTKGGQDIRFEKGAVLTLEVSSRGKVKPVK